jgi:hypothetical protein
VDLIVGAAADAAIGETDSVAIPGAAIAMMTAAAATVTTTARPARWFLAGWRCRPTRR